MQSPLEYSGTEWHTVTVVRYGGGGQLSVDNELVGKASGNCGAPAALVAPFYYGGLRELTADIETNLQVRFALRNTEFNIETSTYLVVRRNGITWL